MIATYLTAERDLGRIAGDADIDTLAPTLIGAAHLLFADRTSSPPTPDAVHGMVTTVIAHVASEKGNRRRPPDVGPSMADMPPGRITLRLRRLWQEQRWIRAPLLLIPLALGFGFWWLTRPQLPTQQEAQQEVATQVGQREHTTVTATCTEPQDSGYSCTLRDAAGRYGYAITTFTKNKSNNRYGHKWDSTTIWEFPLNADGTGTKTLDTSPPRDLSLALTAAASAIGNSIGRNFPDMYGAIKCGDRVTSEVTMCAVRAPLLSATIQALGDNKYQLTYRVALP
jgi:hypothetical protein